MFRRPPYTLWRYITLEILAIFAVALLIQTAMNLGLLTFQLVQSEGLQLSFILPFLFDIALLSIYYTVPISLLFAVTLAFGRMVADQEVTALKACGISYAQLMAPAFVLGVLCVGVSHHINSSVVPEVRNERRNLKRRFLTQLTDLGVGKERTITLPRGMGKITCGRFHRNVLENVFISVWDIGRLSGDSREAVPQEFPIQISARRAEVHQVDNDRLIVDLLDAEVNIPDNVLRQGRGGDGGGDQYFIQRIDAGRWRLPISLSESEPREKDKVTAALREEIILKERLLAQQRELFGGENDPEARKNLQESMRRLQRDLHDLHGEIWRRGAFSLSCLSFLWAGVPLTLWLNRKNRLVPFFLGNLLAVGVFYPCTTVGMLMSEKGLPSPALLHSGNIVLFGVGCVILWRLRKT